MQLIYWPLCSSKGQPSYNLALVAVSKKMRRNFEAPTRQYAGLEIASRPTIVPAAIGRYAPKKKTIKLELGCISKQ